MNAGLALFGLLALVEPDVARAVTTSEYSPRPDITPARIGRCYRRPVSTQVELVVAWRLHAGRAVEVAVVDDGGQPQLASCIGRRLRRARFTGAPLNTERTEWTFLFLPHTDGDLGGAG